MGKQENYQIKFAAIAPQTLLNKLSKTEQQFITERAAEHRFTQQELREICQISNDLEMFKEAPISELWPSEELPKKQAFAQLRTAFEQITNQPKTYVEFGAQDKPKAIKPNLVSVEKPNLGLGYCPVASEKTRCCNLLTLDAVERCGFDCSYCSIQSFYHENEVRYDAGFADKLNNIQLEPNKLYHIGTGQSSDSLMWGNLNGNLEALCDFARNNPNVLLEFKTKSKNIKWLLDNDVPKNVLSTWSLNPQVIVDYEEHQSASLEDRIKCAEKLAAKGNIVGFHFHPMIWYDNFKHDYAQIAQSLTNRFNPDQVAMVSMGTLTYTKDVMRTIRKRNFKSKILQMPLDKVAGKFAYPEHIKIDMFSHLHQALTPWHDEVFFYLCMEPEHLWQPSLGGLKYQTNKQLETAMKTSYYQKQLTAGGVEVADLVF